MKHSIVDGPILRLFNDSLGAFVFECNGELLAQMEVAIVGDTVTVYHTYLVSQDKSQDLRPMLLAAMVDFVRINRLKVIVLCPFVYVQFNAKAMEYIDVWKQTGIRDKIKTEIVDGLK